MSRAVLLTRWVASSFVLATMLMLCAGRVNGALTAYLLIFAGMGLAIALVTDSSQGKERRKPGPAEIHPGSRVAASLLFLATVLVAALDAGRFHWTQPASETTQDFALALLMLAAVLQVWAMAVNPFFSTAIRIQPERRHELVTSGPYSFVRHPGYLAMTIIMPATALTLGSVIALIPALSYSVLILHRTVSEDLFLTEELRGYVGYATAVPFRLIPGIW
ncbi:MAG TPA: isoprenylcysteine carboxylmethyltransferase family protein [Terriglobia bacterium]|nr:isoprenylcysteine carboxylmethyltransferase family protein [Terriglobia bacterium]